MCDRNCDGLVDTLSHMIKQSITIVSATETPTCLHSEMCWSADGSYLHQRIMPDISRYLGVGTELAVASVKDQAPGWWRSEREVPRWLDMKWIAGQYYQSICQYANLPMNQESVYEAIGFEADLWGTPKGRRPASSWKMSSATCWRWRGCFDPGRRGSLCQCDLRGLSAPGLHAGQLADLCPDRKAIPTIVPDYAAPSSNATMRLMMMLVMGEAIPEETAEKELRLVGIKSDHICDTLNELISKYTLEPGPWWCRWSGTPSRLELESGTETMLRIRDKAEFLDHAGLSFRPPTTSPRMTKENSSYMDAKLFGHIYQAVLPGQFFTYDGKYYEVRSVTPEKGVLVRRAADHIVGRRYYRQNAALSPGVPDEESGRSRHINGLEVTICGYEISVETNGYLELDESTCAGPGRSASPTTSARATSTLSMSGTTATRMCCGSGSPRPPEEVRYTLCLLLMEVFHTVYADAWPYLAAVTAQTGKTRDALRGCCTPWTAPAAGAGQRPGGGGLHLHH